MKHLHKFASVLLALVMALSLMVPAFAEDTQPAAKGSITINNATKEHTYFAYQIFSGDLSYDAVTENPDDLTNPVLANIEWGSGVDEEKIPAVLEKLGLSTDLTAAEVAAILAGDYNVSTGLGDTEIEGQALVSAKDFAQAISAALTDVNASASAVEQDGKYVANINDLAFGYYLVRDSAPYNGDSPTGNGSDNNAAVSLYMLQVVGPATVESKVGVPTPDKKIVEGENRVNTGDYNIGDTVTFELKATLPENYDNYKNYTLVFHDTMSAGLTLNVDSITPNWNGKPTNVTPNDYMISTEKNEDGCTLEVSFKNLKAGNTAGLKAGDVITVTYTATLNANAVVGNPGNPNAMHLEFSRNPNDDGDGETGKTPDKEVLVFTYELDTTKVDGQNPDTKLEGAEFRLFKGEAGQDGKVAEANRQYVKITDGKVSGWTEAGVTEGAATLTSDEDGLFVISGLDAGTYYLEETKAPTGYNLLADPIKVVITATIKDNDGVPGVENALEKLEITVGEKTEAGNASTGIVNTTVQNNKGATLPETGGIGTTIFYVVGGLLTVGAVVLLVTKKRMSVDSDK